MYKFVEVTEEAERSLSRIQTTFNGNNLDDALTDDTGSFTTLTVSGRGELYRRVRTIDVPAMDGAWEEERATTDVRTITVKYKIKDKTSEGIRERFKNLKSLLVGSKRHLEFTDEQVIFYATLQSLEVPEEENNDLVGNIMFLCTDPFKYGPEQSQALDDVDLIENTGTAEADPIFELTAKEKSTFAMVSLGADEDSEYNLVGVPADDDVEEVDTKTRVLYENGSTIDTWETANNDLIDEHAIEIAGEMGADATGVRPDSYGTGDGIHGPAVFKEITPIQDFEIEATFDINSIRVSDSWRMGINFLDENLNMLGHIGIKDNNAMLQRRTPLARFGEWRGSGKSNGNLLGDEDKFDNSRNLTLFHLRVKRVGNTIDFYIAEWRGSKHERSWHETYRGLDNKYSGKLKYITLYIGNYADRFLPSRLRINSIEVSELSQATVDQTPYILREGDVVTFDHKNDDILINGEPVNELKNFGGSFFKLKKGYNNIIVTPRDAFDTKITYRNKYL